MSLSLAAVFSLLGLVGLTIGADALVRGATRLATSLGVSPLVVGLTVVAYGTSAPEIVASVVAALQDRGQITVGNVVGSNIANIGLILGATAIATPIPVARSLLKRELPILLAVTFLFALLSLRLSLDIWVGLSFLLLLLLFNYLTFVWTKAEDSPDADPTRAERKQETLPSLGLTALGLLLLLGGAHLLVEGAVAIARAVGIDDFIIGVTLVAVGTSLPELATSVVAGLRKEADLVVGNLVGSNLFNLLGALGMASLIRPLAIPEALWSFELPALFVFTVAMAVFLSTGRRVVRIEGVVLLAAYAAFIALLFL
jgi:cation:H+ antiporter